MYIYEYVIRRVNSGKYVVSAYPLLIVIMVAYVYGLYFCEFLEEQEASYHVYHLNSVYTFKQNKNKQTYC